MKYLIFIFPEQGVSQKPVRLCWVSREKKLEPVELGVHGTCHPPRLLCSAPSGPLWTVHTSWLWRPQLSEYTEKSSQIFPFLGNKINLPEAFGRGFRRHILFFRISKLVWSRTTDMICKCISNLKKKFTILVLLNGEDLDHDF